MPSSTLYTPKHFSATREQLLNIVRRTHLATFVTSSISTENPTKPEIKATHLPTLLIENPDGKLQLVGHLAKANQHWKCLTPESTSVAIFHCNSDAYISPSYYPSKKTNDGKVVPTWNYAAVHLSGPVNVITEPKGQREIVSRLSDHHELLINGEWKLSDAPDSYVDAMLKGIVGIVMDVEEVEGIVKMSQNKITTGDFDGTVEGLEKRSKEGAGTLDGEKAGSTAEWMRSLKNT